MLSTLSDTALFILQRRASEPQEWLALPGEGPQHLCVRGETSPWRFLSRKHHRVCPGGLSTALIQHSPSCPCHALAPEPGDQLLTAPPEGLTQLSKLGEGATPRKGLQEAGCWSAPTQRNSLCPRIRSQAVLTCCFASPAVPVLESPGGPDGDVRWGLSREAPWEVSERGRLTECGVQVLWAEDLLVQLLGLLVLVLLQVGSGLWRAWWGSAPAGASQDACPASLPLLLGL